MTPPPTILCNGGPPPCYVRSAGTAPGNPAGRGSVISSMRTGLLRHDEPGTPDRATLRRIAAAVATILLFLLAVFAIGRMLHAVHYREVIFELEHLPSAAVLEAIAATVASYLALVGYDWSALRYVGARLAPAEVALASFCAHAIGNSSGSGVLFGGAVRFRLYAARGLSPGQVARVVSFCALGFGLGISLVGAAATAARPGLLAAVSGLPAPVLRGAGTGVALAALALALAPFVRRRPLALGRLRLPLPSGWLMLGQLAVSVVDILFAGTALYVLLPAGTVSFPALLTVYAVALIAGVVSHVPGGLGVLEGLVIYALRDRLPLETLTAALLGYRVIYYLLPLTAGAVILAGLEAAQAKRSAAALSIARTVGGWVSGLVPFVIAMMAFAAGVILLASGATPAAGWRLALLEQWVPLPLIHLSHFLASLAGVALLLLAHGLRRRLSAAYWLTAVLLAANIVLSLGKGLAYREALVLLAMLIVLVLCRRQFYRPSSLFQQTLTPAWWTAVIMAVGGSFLLALFAFKHVEYAHDLWWQFALHEQAPRTMRAALGVIVFLAAIGLLQLLRPAPPRITTPTAGDLDRAAAVIRAQDRADANLALMGDKALLFNESGTGFVMFAVRGRTWAALGDPVGPRDTWIDLLWRLKERADAGGGRLACYEVRAEALPLYVDLGMRLYKLGEEARLDLAAFDLRGGQRKALRYTLARCQRDGIEVAFLDPAGTAARLAELKEVSDAWLSTRSAREKRFSLGWFAPDYVARFPSAIVTERGRLVAFATLMTTDTGCEWAVDLMRHRAGCHPLTMELLLLSMIQRARSAGARVFSLGMAPLAGLEDPRLETWWPRFGRLLYSHGEPFYNFEGVRAFKAKFCPRWEPRYLAVPAGVNPLVALTDIAALASGGLKGLIEK